MIPSMNPSKSGTAASRCGDFSEIATPLRCNKFHLRLCSRLRSDVGAVMAEQQHQDDDQHHDPHQAVTAAAVVTAAISPITAAAAKQQDQNDKENDETHWSPFPRREFRKAIRPRK